MAWFLSRGNWVVKEKMRPGLDAGKGGFGYFTLRTALRPPWRPGRHKLLGWKGDPNHVVASAVGDRLAAALASGEAQAVVVASAVGCLAVVFSTSPFRGPTVPHEHDGQALVFSGERPFPTYSPPPLLLLLAKRRRPPEGNWGLRSVAPGGSGPPSTLPGGTGATGGQVSRRGNIIWRSRTRGGRRSERLPTCIAPARLWKPSVQACPGNV